MTSMAQPDELRGVIPILVTPFTGDGSVDLGAMDRQIDFLAGAGVRWAGFGFGSEVHRMGDAELASLVRRAVSASAGRVAIFGNAEVRSVTGGVEQVARVAETGARMALLRPGGLDGIPQEGLFEIIAEVAEKGGLPVVVQDAPQNTGVDISPATLARLLVEVDGVAAVKVEPANPARKIGLVAECLAGSERRIIGGGGGLEYLQELARGACATMPGPAHPELFAALTRLHAGGQREEAHRLFARAAPLLVLARRDMDSFLFVQKHVLVRRGVLPNAALGVPQRRVDPGLGAEVDEVLEALDLLALFEECANAAG